MMDDVCDNVYCPMVLGMANPKEECLVKAIGQYSYISRLVKVENDVWDSVCNRASGLMLSKGVKGCTPSEGFGCMQFLLKECMQILQSAPQGMAITFVDSKIASKP